MIRTSRVQSVDLLRGLACVLMAIDHVRVYSGIPAGGPDPGVFLTRWVTHFVAPAFCFFAGIAAWFHGERSGDHAALRRFLVTRGLLLVVLEFTLIRFLWAFEVGTSFQLAGVIWMLGWSMVVLALVVRWRPSRVAGLGIAIVALQQLFGVVPGLVPAGARPAFANVWNFVYPAGAEPWPGIQILYVLVPWVGVMMAGYGFGALWQRPADERDRLFHRLGLAMTLAFVCFATGFALTSAPPSSAGGAPAPSLWMRVLDQQKYPASQLFLLMTLGPAIAMLPSAERARGRLSRWLTVTGRVPMFYYLAHLLVIHLLAIAAMYLRHGPFPHDWYATAPYTWVPHAVEWPLGLLYVVWAIASAILLVLCAWYARRKATQPSPWMRYL